MSILLAIRLDNRHIGAGPATVVARPASVAEFLALATDRDGARDASLRLWEGDFPIGARVSVSLRCGTGQGIVHPEGASCGMYCFCERCANKL